MRIHSKFVSRTAIMGAILAFSCAPSGAQKADSTAATIKINTRLVSVDTIVTDKSGKAVTGLKPEDFSVLEDGKPQAVAGFDFTSPQARNASAATKQVIPPGVYTNRPEQDSGEYTILLLDALNTPLADQMYGRKAMLDYLKSQHRPGQKLAVFALTKRLLLLQDFTSDTELLSRALEKFKAKPSSLLVDVELPTMPNTNPRMIQNLKSFLEDQTAYRTDQRVQLTLDAFNSISRAVAGYPGRKSLVWLSAAFPLYLEPGRRTGFTSQRTYGEQLERTATLISEAKIAIYPVDARGLVGSFVVDASSSGLGVDGRIKFGQDFANEVASSGRNLSYSHDAMKVVAENTGGRAFYSRNDIDNSVALSVDDGSTYYSLAYYPENKKYDGKFRKIEVKLNRPGLQVRHRRGYLAVAPDVAKQENLEQVVSSTIADPLTATNIAFFASAQPLATSQEPQGSSALSRKNTKLGVRFLVDTHDVYFDKNEAGLQVADVLFAVAAISPDDKMIGHAEQRLQTNFKPESFAEVLKSGLIFSTQLDLPPGKYRLRLMVRDNRTGLIGSLDVPYVVQ